MLNPLFRLLGKLTKNRGRQNYTIFLLEQFPKLYYNCNYVTKLTLLRITTLSGSHTAALLAMCTPNTKSTAIRLLSNLLDRLVLVTLNLCRNITYTKINRAAAGKGNR